MTEVIGYFTDLANVHVQKVGDSPLFIGDDFGDNKYEKRDRFVTNILFPHPNFRPEWTSAVGSPSVTDGVLVCSAGAEEAVEIPTTFFVGVFEFDTKHTGDLTGGGSYLMVYLDGAVKYYLSSWVYSDNYGLYDCVDAVWVIKVTHAEDTSWHTCKTTRDADGNFEVFFDGTSDGTATDTTTTSIDTIRLTQPSASSNYDVHFDNLKVYKL